MILGALTPALLSNDRLAERRWPVLFWANRVALVAAAACLATTIALLILESVNAPASSDRSRIDGLIGAAYVLTAVFGVGFMLTGYLRLFMVHRTPGHEIQPRPPRRGISLFQRLAGGAVLLSAIAAGWVHWGIGTAILFLVVFAVVYLPVLWR